MNRTIITAAMVAEYKKSIKILQFEGETSEMQVIEAPPKEDNFVDRIIKYVPTEVIAVYIALSNIVQLDTTRYRPFYLWGVLTFGIMGTIVWLKRRSKVGNNMQVSLSCIAFTAWALSISEAPFYIQPTLKAMIAPLSTFIIAAIKPGK